MRGSFIELLFWKWMKLVMISEAKEPPFTREKVGVICACLISQIKALVFYAK